MDKKQAMMMVRPAYRQDIDPVTALAERSDSGLTNLPGDRSLIAERVERSLTSFDQRGETAEDASYLLVMEDRTSGRLLGTAGIVRRVGIGEPFYAYRIKNHIQESMSLGLRKEVPCLHLKKIHHGPSEIGALFMHPDFRRHGYGRLMSLSRFHFLAAHAERFPSKVLAEMRGITDRQGRSPFWEAVGRHFFDTDFSVADYLTAKNKRFIGELMPSHPIYIPLLREEARSVIGKVHEGTKAALKMLEGEGFTDSGMVDIFDAGPIIECRIRKIRSVRERKVARYLGIRKSKTDPGPWLVSVGHWKDFRACISQDILVEKEGVRLPGSVAEILRIQHGEPLSYSFLRPREA